MTEQWQELKETIIEMRDNGGICTQQEVCKFLANYMDNLEKQMQEPILDKIRAEIEKHCGLTKENYCRYCSYCNSVMGVREILAIIDKYKVESEG